MPTEEQLRLQARVVTQTSQLDSLIGKLTLAEQVANRLDDSTIDINVNDGEVDALIAKLSALESGDLFNGNLLGDFDADILDDINADDLTPNLDDTVEGVEFDADVLGDLPDGVLDSVDADVLDDVPDSVLDSVDADVLDNTDADVLGDLPDGVLDNIDATEIVDAIDADVLDDSDESELTNAVRALVDTLDQEFIVTQEQRDRPDSSVAADAAESDGDSSDRDDGSDRGRKDVLQGQRVFEAAENRESLPLTEVFDDFLVENVESVPLPELIEPEDIDALESNELDDIASRGMGRRINNAIQREDLGDDLPAVSEGPEGERGPTNTGLPATLSSFGGEEQTIEGNPPLEQLRRLNTRISVDPDPLRDQLDPLRDVVTDFEIENFQRDDDGRIIRGGALTPGGSIAVEPEGFERIEMGPEGPPDPEQVAGLPVVADPADRAGSRSGFSTEAQTTFDRGTFSDIGEGFDMSAFDDDVITNKADHPLVDKVYAETLDSDEVDKRVEGLFRGARDEFNPVLDANPPDMREAIDDEDLMQEDRRGSRGVAGAARNALSRFTELSQTRVGLTKFYDILAIFVPTLLAFQATMPLVIGGLYSLAAAAAASTAALGAIGGLGLLGAAQNEAGGGMPSQEDFSAVFDGVGEEFVEAFRPVTERLAPLFEDAVDALGPLFDRLAGVSEQLLGLRGPVRDLGGFVADNLVEGLNSTLAFADAAVPLFRTIGGAVEDINLARAFSGVLADAIPTLAAFSSIIVQSLPGILEFARGMSLVTRSVLFLTSEIVGLLDPLLELIPGIDSGVAALGTLAGVALTAATATLLYGKVVALATSAQAAFIAAKLKSLAAYAGTIVMSKLAAAGVSFFGAATAGAAAGVLTLATAVGLLTAGLSILAGTLAGLGAGFTSMGSDVSDATDELEAFSQQRDSMVGRNTAMMGDLDREVYVNVTQDNSTTVEGNADESSMATLSAESDGGSFKPGELPPGVYNA